MKKINTFAALLLMAAAAMFSTSCENDNINPYDYVNNGGNGSNENQGSENTNEGGRISCRFCGLEQGYYPERER